MTDMCRGLEKGRGVSGMTERELIVLLDEDGQQIGTADKDQVHTFNTKLHLAFSCYVQNADGEVLVTRRALTKKTWPGVWSNSFCGHPKPGEAILEAVQRRALWELGITLRDLRVVMPDFRYSAVDCTGITENEICPVFSATAEGELSPRPDEVIDHNWVDPLDLNRAIKLTPWAFSPWLVLQVRQMASLGLLPCFTPEHPVKKMAWFRIGKDQP